MIIIAIIILAGLAICNWRLGNVPFNAPALFAGFWGVLLLLLLLAGDRFYPLSDTALAVFVVGAACYSVGGILGFAVLAPQRDCRPLSPRHREFLWRVIDVGLAAMILVLPFYLNRLGEIIDNCRMTLDPAIALRYEITMAERGALGIELYGYLIVAFDFLTLVAWSECDGSPRQQRRCWIMTALVLAYHLSNASRLGAILFVLTLLWVVFLRGRKMSFTPIAAAAIAVAVVFTGAAIVLGKGGSRDAGFLENATNIVDAFLTYLLGGLVAFNEVVHNPAMVQEDLFIFFQNVANAFGADYHVIKFEPQFVATPALTNVFTIYMSPYAQYGFVGVVVFMLLLGVLCALILRAFEHGAPWAVVIHARVVSCILLTSFTDPYLCSLSVWIQVAVYAWSIYGLPRLFLDRSVAPGARRPLSKSTRRVIEARTCNAEETGCCAIVTSEASRSIE